MIERALFIVILCILVVFLARFLLGLG